MGKCFLCDSYTANVPTKCCGSVACDSCKGEGCFCGCTPRDRTFQRLVWGLLLILMTLIYACIYLVMWTEAVRK